MLAIWFGEVVASIVNYVAACVLIELGVIFGVGIVLAQALVPMYATYLSYQLLRFLMENPQSNKKSFKDYLNKCFLGLVSVGLGSSLFIGLLSCSAWAYAQSRFFITFGEGLIGYYSRVFLYELKIHNKFVSYLFNQQSSFCNDLAKRLKRLAKHVRNVSVQLGKSGCCVCRETCCEFVAHRARLGTLCGWFSGASLCAFNSILGCL